MLQTILLSTGTGGGENYENALRALGVKAVSAYCPPSDTSYDGLILCGGSDVEPRRFGEANCGSTGIDLARDAAEFALIEAYRKVGKPIFGICRGFQLLNIAFGGTLIQDLPTRGHELHTPELPEKKDKHHVVSAEGNSFFSACYGEQFWVNSAHHQGLGEMGRGLRPTLRADDGTIEAMEHESLPIWGVQFHPERMCLAHRQGKLVDGLPILEHFLHS